MFNHNLKKKKKNRCCSAKNTFFFYLLPENRCVQYKSTILLYMNIFLGSGTAPWEIFVHIRACKKPSGFFDAAPSTKRNKTGCRSRHVWVFGSESGPSIFFHVSLSNIYVFSVFFYLVKNLLINFLLKLYLVSIWYTII